MKKIYLIGSLRNPEVPKIAAAIRNLGFNVFDDWHAAGPTADDEWKRYEQERGRTYIDALRNGEAAEHVFSFDEYHLNTSDIGVLVLPAGKSGHLELGLLGGQGKPIFILLAPDDVRWDVMYKFAQRGQGVCSTLEDLLIQLQSRHL